MQMAALDAAVESAALQLLSRCSQLENAFPRIIGSSTSKAARKGVVAAVGGLQLPLSGINQPVAIPDLEWTAMSACKGTPLVELDAIPEAAVAALGAAVAQVHSVSAEAVVSPEGGAR